MTSAGLWGVVPQAEAVVHDATRAVENLEPADSSTTGSGSSGPLDKEHGELEVARLARQLTQHSVKNKDGSYPNPFEGSDDPALDPHSGKFNPEIWTKTLLGSDLRLSRLR